MAIEDAEVTVEEIEAEVEPEPTLEAAPTPTQQLPTEEPPADQGLTNLTSTQVENAVSQFAFKEGWAFTDPRDRVSSEEAFTFIVDHNVPGSQSGDCTTREDCYFESSSYQINIRNAATPESQDEDYFYDRFDHRCETSAIKTVVFRGAKVTVSGGEVFLLVKVRENGIVVPIDAPCQGFSTDPINDEVHRIFDSLINFLR